MLEQLQPDAVATTGCAGGSGVVSPSAVATAPLARNRVAGLSCLRCGTLYPPDHFTADCPACRAAAPSNLAVEYAGDVLEGVTRQSLAAGPRSLWRYAHSLPVDADQAVSLGEGLTPLIDLPRLARELDLGSLEAKCELGNPTGSFKDRLASVAVSAGRALFGARVIASSSSGNAGAAAAAYAARAGLPCIVFTFVGTAGPMVTQMRAYGAMVVAVADKAHRWMLLEAGVRRFGWFPTSPFFGPVVGSNPYGIEGYKSLAYEVAEQRGWRLPDWIVLPVCYGDALVGMARGFAELLRLGWIERVPRLVAAEIYGSLSQAEREGRDDPPSIPRSYDTVAVSIGAAQSTFQALKAVRDSGGAVMRVPDDALLHWHRALAREEGLFVEPAAAAALAAVDLLRRQGTVRRGEAVVCLITAGGLKDPAVAEPATPIPTVPPDLDQALAAVQKVYGIDVTRLSNLQGEGADR
jgi:threonine synthase